MDERRQELEEGLDLNEYVEYVIRNIKTVVAAGVIGLLVGLVYVYILATPQYEATAQLYVVNSKDSVVNLSDLQIGSYLTSDYQLVFDTWEVNEMVIKRLGLDYTAKELGEKVKVTNPGDTRALFITVRTEDAKEAAEIANGYAEVAKEYITMVMQTETPTTLSEALAPEEAVSPRPVRTMALSIMMAVLIALGLMLIKSARDDKVKTAEDVERCTGMKPLAVIPEVERRSRGQRRGWAD